jgi:hypothetical protein
VRNQLSEKRLSPNRPLEFSRPPRRSLSPPHGDRLIGAAHLGHRRSRAVGGAHPCSYARRGAHVTIEWGTGVGRPNDISPRAMTTARAALRALLVSAGGASGQTPPPGPSATASGSPCATASSAPVPPAAPRVLTMRHRRRHRPPPSLLGANVRCRD